VDRVVGAHTSLTLLGTLQEVREHAAALVPDGFIAATPPEYLAHLERYLRATLGNRCTPERLRLLLGGNGSGSASDLPDLADLSTQIRVLTVHSDGSDGLDLSPELRTALREVGRLRDEVVSGGALNADRTLAVLDAVGETLRLIGAESDQAEVRELIAATGATPSPQDPATAEVFAQMAADVEASVRVTPPILPGARRITSMLSEIGLAQVIVTQSPRRIVESVAHALGDVFVGLITGDDGLPGKPTPAPYAAAIEFLGLRPEECVAVEDSPTGAASARGNGIHVVQIGATKHFPADPGLVVVPDLASITPHLLLWAQR